MNILNAMKDAAGQGLLWGIMALGVYITFRLLDFADLTVDGSFATGGCVCAICIANYNMDPILALIFATIAGGLAGMLTGLLHTIAKIPAILAGILTMIALYSINLHILGRSNLPLLKSPSIFDSFEDTFQVKSTTSALIIGVIAVIIILIICYWIFGTQIGSAIRATGNNEQMVRAMGINTSVTKVLGLTISNGLVGLSGALVAQSQGYADVKMGIGSIIIGLASIVIGEVLISSKASFFTVLSFVVVGSIIYRIVIAIVLQLGLSTDDLKLLTAIIVTIALAIPVILAKIDRYQKYHKLNAQIEWDGDNVD